MSIWRERFKTVWRWLNTPLFQSKSLHPSQASVKTESDENLEIWLEILDAEIKSGSNPKIIYPILGKYRNKLNIKFAETVSKWFRSEVKKNDIGSNRELARNLFNFAIDIYQFPLGSRADNLEIAIALYQAALEVYTRTAFPENWANTQMGLANAYYCRIRGERSQNLEQAIALFQAALEVFTRTAFPQDWARTQMNLGLAYYDRIRGERSQNLEQAIALFQAALEVRTRTAFPQDWARTQMNLGLAYYDRIRGERSQNLEQAIALYQAALEVRTRTAFPQDWARTQMNLGVAYYHRIRGERSQNLEQAIALFQAALEVYTRTAFPQDWAMTQMNLGLTYSVRIQGERSQNLEQAIALYQAALEVRTRTAFPQDWARTQMNLGVAYYHRIRGERSQNLEQAIALYQAALEVYTRTAFPEDWAKTQHNLGEAYHYRIQGERSQNLEQAIALYQAALDVFTTAFPENWARTQHNLGEAYEAQSDNPKAITAYQQALEIFTPSSFPLDCLETGSNLGHLASQQSDWETAIEGYHNAILAIEQSRNWATSPRSKQELLESALPLYGQLIEACLHLNRPQQALLTVERSKSRRLIELLTQSDRLPQNATPQQQQQYRQLLRDIATLEQSLPDDLPQTPLNPDSQQRSAQLSPASSPQSDLKQLLQQREQLLQDINDPDFTALQTVTPQLPDFRQLLSPNSAIIEWYLPQDPNLGGYIFLIHLQQNQPQIQALRYSTQQRQTLDQFNHHYFADYRDRSWYEQLDTRLDELGQHLDLDRLLDHLPNRCQRLILIPHLYLHLFPLHALPIRPQDSDAPQLLLDRFPEGVSYAPSAQILAYLHQRRQRPDPRQFFAIQNPTQDLPYTDMEVSFIRPNFDPNSHILKGHQASKDQLNRPQTLEKLRQSHLIHFACHGGFDNANPLNSALLLAGNAPLNLEGRRTLTLRDGRRFDLDSQGLTLREIYRTLDLPACRLVILSACETGLLSSQLTDECIGLATGFLAVGSLSVLSTLWCVDDFATAWLTIRFYDEFRQDGDVVKAVYRAQQWLRQVSVADFLIWCRDSLKMSATDLDELEFQLEDYNQTAPFESRRHWSSLLVSGL